jgi:hypothetical protein
MPRFNRKKENMPPLGEFEAFTKGKFGLQVARAAAALPQSTSEALFNIEAGRIALNLILGEVTTIIETQANNTKLISTPDTGTAVDMCAVLDITADEVGTLYGISGLNSDALIGINAGLVPGMVRPLILPPGSIDLSCAASNTGAVKWLAFWMPIDDGAYLEAA